MEDMVSQLGIIPLMQSNVMAIIKISSTTKVLESNLTSFLIKGNLRD